MGEIFRFPLKQGIGAKAAAATVKGDHVDRGQLLAFIEEGNLGANIYTSVSGTVKEVTEDEIIIRADEKQSSDYIPLKGNDALELIKESGLVGLGGAGFPTYAKLSKAFDSGGVVIINAAECEPILEHNIRAIEESPAILLRGLEIAMEVTKAERGIIAIKGIHEKAIEKLEDAIRSYHESGSDRLFASKIEISRLPNIYPMGEERAVIRETLGRLLSVNSLPLEADAIVINAETACRIKEAVDDKKPLIDKNVTIAGKIKGCEDADIIRVYMDVPIGRSVSKLFEMAGGLKGGYGEIIMGGPFTGKRTEIDAPIVKTTGGLIATECFPKGPDKIGLLVCACGADECRMRQLAESLGSEVAGVEFCKQAIEVRGTRKCENPGRCPGQAQKVMNLKKAGAQAVLISNCTDCSNTVMSCAPQLKLPVYHCTDQALRAVNEHLIRKIHD